MHFQGGISGFELLKTLYAANEDFEELYLVYQKHPKGTF